MTFSGGDTLGVFYQRGQTGAVMVTGPLPAGRFTFVVVNLNGVAPELWLDGTRVATKARRLDAAPIGPSMPLTVGGPGGPGLRAFVGTIDEVATFSRPLRPAEIQALWRRAKA